MMRVLLLLIPLFFLVSTGEVSAAATADPVAANAKAAQSHLNNCKASHSPYAVASIIVDCVTYSLRSALDLFQDAVSAALTPTITALMALSLIWLGIRIFSGVQEMNKEVMIYVIRLSMVIWFLVSLDFFTSIPFIVVDYTTNLVVGGYSPWEAIDQLFCTFFGSGCSEDRQLQNGLMGLVQPALTSGLIGVLIFIIGNLSMVFMIWFAFRAMHTYLASIALIAFVMLLAPIFIPLAVFGYTSRYVFKWLDFLFVAIIHPVLLFAFLYMFLGTINYTLNWFAYEIMGGTNFEEFWRSKQPMFSWIQTNDPALINKMEQVMEMDKGRSVMQSFSSPGMTSSVQASPFEMFALDFGSQQVLAMQSMVFGFLALFIVSYLMLSMVNVLPKVSESIAGVVLGLQVEGVPFVSEVAAQLNQMGISIKGGK